MLKRRHQPGIRLKQQKGCEEQHALNHQVCLFQTVSTMGFTPGACAQIVHGVPQDWAHSVLNI